ncbi:MAG: hypothetical protein HC908_05760 [Calothrix sp. SM1_7_51]|nr:hypothetical protein [Calothrix sp. SM1_7_51]
MSESTTNLSVSESIPFDAQQIAEEIAAGDQKAPKVDIAADYEASKEFSFSETDSSSEPEKSTVAATAPKFQQTEQEETGSEAQPTGDPTEFLEMAQEVNPFIE